MNYAHPAPELERLPWLNDDIGIARPSAPAPLLLWSGVAALLIAGASYWIGMNGAVAPVDQFAGPADGPSATITLPQPLAPEPETQPAASPAVAIDTPAPAGPTITLDRPRPVVLSRPRTAGATAEAAEVKPASEEESAPVEAEPPKPLTLWPASQSAGAEGKIVRIGTFSNRRQAKIGWRQLVRVYPGMGRLQATVVKKPSLRIGRDFYRLQFGTTSQAHSEVLCQWMKSIGQSCIVVGLQEKAQS